MRTSAKLVRWCVVVPAVLAGSVLAVMVSGLLPDPVEVVVLAAVGALIGLLACGHLERPAARLVGGARGLRPGERAILTPVMRRVHAAGLDLGSVYVRRVGLPRGPVEPIGRTSVVVDPLLLRAMRRDWVTPEEAAGAFAHAVACRQAGPSGFDLAIRAWTLPWQLLWAFCVRVAGAFAWLPWAELAWSLRFVLGAVALARSVEQGQTFAGVGAGGLVLISYVAPAADRAWRRMVERDADALVAKHGLGTELAQFVERHGAPDAADAMERVHRLRTTGSNPRLHLVAN